MDARQWVGEPEARHDPNAGSAGIPYVCRTCDWTGRGGIKALEHHVVTGHPIRGKRWPVSWPDAQFQPRTA